MYGFPRKGENEDRKIFTVVQPDVCVICDPLKVDARVAPGPRYVIEILSPGNNKRKYVINLKCMKNRVFLNTDNITTGYNIFKIYIDKWALSGFETDE